MFTRVIVPVHVCIRSSYHCSKSLLSTDKYPRFGQNVQNLSVLANVAIRLTY